MELQRQCRMVGQLWNAMLEMEERAYSRARGQRGVTHRPGRSFLTFFDLTAEITQLRAACPEWSALSVWTAHRVAKALTRAFEAFFRRAKAGAGAQSGYPRYRSWRDQNWLPHRFASGCRLDHVCGKSWALKLKGVEGAIHVRGKLRSAPEKCTDADIREINGVWWLSVGADMGERKRAHGREALTVQIGIIGAFAVVNGARVMAASVRVPAAPDVAAIQERMAETDRRTPEYRRLRMAKARIEAKVARRRREALHVWTTGLVGRASEIVLVRPKSVSRDTASGRGDAQNWGAAVATKAALNRHVLDQAPAMVAQMFKYKCEEAGIPFRECSHDDLDVGRLVVLNRKAARRVRKTIKEEAA
jgi:putative transposase